MNNKIALLEIEKLSTNYACAGSQAQILQDVSCSVQAGECVGLIGESGSGKTTLIQAILGILSLRGGSIEQGLIKYKGCLLDEMPDIIGREITYVPQDPESAFDPFFSIEDQFREVTRKMSGQDLGLQNEVSIEKIFHMVGLSIEEVDPQSFPHQLSGGIKQRVLLALALLTNPELLILDEPTSNLDVVHERRIIELLQSIKKTVSPGIVLTTHNIALAMELCERICIMRCGQIIESGSVADLKKRQTHEYTRELFAGAAL